MLFSLARKDLTVIAFPLISYSSLLKDIAQSGLDFELNFSDFKTPYGFIVKDNHSFFMQICENSFNNPELVYHDVKQTLNNMIIPQLKTINQHELGFQSLLS